MTSPPAWKRWRPDQKNNHAEWKAVLDEFFAEFSEQLETAEKDPEEGGMRPNQDGDDQH